MTDVLVTLSANAGICVQIGKHRIWVDALHKEKQPGFSAVTDALYRQIMTSDAFKAPDHICVTHCHPDHYSEAMVQEALKLWPSARLWLPGQESVVEDEDLTLEFIRLQHEGAQYADVPHYGILICVDGKHILIPGDCETASPALKEAIGERRIDLALLNFPWVTLSKGRDFLARTMKPKHILLYHLPFAQDDVNGFLTSAQRNAQILAQTDIRLLCKPLQAEKVNI